MYVSMELHVIAKLRWDANSKITAHCKHDRLAVSARYSILWDYRFEPTLILNTTGCTFAKH